MNSENINKIYELSENYDKCQDKVEKQRIEKELKELLAPFKKGSIGLAQINPIVGDIEYNAQKVVENIVHAQNIGLDLVVFPELILMGYPIEDTIDRHPIIVSENVKWLKEIAKITTKTTALVGFVEPRKPDHLTGKKYYNSRYLVRAKFKVLSENRYFRHIRNLTTTDILSHHPLSGFNLKTLSGTLTRTAL